MKRLFKYISLVLVAFLTAGVFVACDKEQTDLVSNLINLEFSSVVYDGTEKKPNVEIKIGKTVIDSAEYDVEYKNNINVGTASVKVSAKEDSKKIKGTVTVGFEIVRANKQVATLADINAVIEDSNYEGVVFNTAFTVLSNETLDIPEGFTLNMGNNVLTNEGKINNKGTIIANKNIVNNGSLNNDGEIKAVVNNFEDLQNAVYYATKIVVDADIQEDVPEVGELANNKLFIAQHMEYDEIEIDLNGHTIRRQVRFEAGYGKKSIKVTNSSSKEAVISTRGLDLTAVILYGSAPNGARQLDAELSNIKVIGDDIGNAGGDKWAAISSNGTFKNCEYFNFVANNCEFVGGGASGTYLPAYYNYKFVDCSFTGTTAYYTKSGVHTLNNCTFNATATTYVEPIYYGNGCYETGSALVLDSAQNYPEPLIVKVNGGKFTSVCGHAIEEFATGVNAEGINFYSTLEVKGTPSYSYANGKEALCTPRFSENSNLNVEEVVNDLYEKVYNCNNLGSENTYSYEELLLELGEDVAYYVEVGSVINIPEVYNIKIGETCFRNGEKVKVSIGNGNFIEDDVFYVSENKLYVSANVLMFEGINNSSIAINGKEFRISKYMVNNIAVTGVNYRGAENSATIVPETVNEYDIEVGTAKDYLEIFYTSVSAEDIIITRKENNGVLSYGLTGTDGDAEHLHLGFYPVGYHNNPEDIPEKFDGSTTNYKFYVVGRGMATLKLNITLK